MKKNGGWIGKKKPILKINSNNNKKIRTKSDR